MFRKLTLSPEFPSSNWRGSSPGPDSRNELESSSVSCYIGKFSKGCPDPWPMGRRNIRAPSHRPASWQRWRGQTLGIRSSGVRSCLQQSGKNFSFIFLHLLFLLPRVSRRWRDMFERTFSIIPPPLSIQRNNVTPNFSPVRSWLLASFFEIGGNWTKLFFLFTKIIQFLGNCFFIITYYFVKNMAEYIRKITLFVLRINLTSQLLREIPARWI